MGTEVNAGQEHIARHLNQIENASDELYKSLDGVKESCGLGVIRTDLSQPLWRLFSVITIVAFRLFTQYACGTMSYGEPARILLVSKMYTKSLAHIAHLRLFSRKFQAI